MAKFYYNFNLITTNENNTFKKILYKTLCKQHGDQNKELTLSELCNGLKKANVFNSLDQLLLSISEFGIDLSDKNNLSIIEPIITTCTEKRISLFNQDIKSEKINNADYLQSVDAILPNGEISLKELTKLDCYTSTLSSFNFLRNTLSNSNATALIILNAEKNLGVENLEVETADSISAYIEDSLKLTKVVNANTYEDALTELKSYTLKK